MYNRLIVEKGTANGQIAGNVGSESPATFIGKIRSS